MPAKKNTTAKAGTGSLRIPAPNQVVAHIPIRSREGSSLITNSLKGANDVSCVDMGIKELRKAKAPGGKVASPKRQPRNPELEYQKSMYPIPGKKNAYGFPAAAIRNSLVTSVKNLKKQGKTSIDGTDVERNVWIDADVGGLVQMTKCSKPRMREDIVRDSGQTRAPRLRYRAEFDKWAAVVKVRFNPDMFSLEEIINLLAHAGLNDGLCEKRAGKGYEHGTYVLDRDLADIKVVPA